MKLFFITLLYSLLTTCLLAQDWCATISTIHQDLAIKAMPAREKGAITIPVAVHILWSETEENISDEQVISQIEALNRDFRALNTDLEAVIPFYENTVADMEINFELATVDPEGNSHTGIIHKAVPPSVWTTPFTGGQRKICYDEHGGSTAWNPSCYLNIWVGRMSLSEIAGIGIFPTQLGEDVPLSEDGVYIRHDRFGTLGTVTSPYHLGRTTTHEIGHYLNLFHPWGANDPDDDCNATLCCEHPDYDDFVEDTEFQIETYLNECPSGNVQSCGEPDNYQNFMGYSLDECLLMFTEGQKARVWDALMTYRPGLLDASCIVSTQTPVELTNWVENIWINGSFIEMYIKAEPLDWQLYDINGRLMTQWQTSNVGQQQYALPIGLSKGLYLLLVRNGNQFQVKKLIVL